MDKKQQEFYKELLAEFRIEAAEHRDSFISCLLNLEKGTSQDKTSALVEVMFREMHSLKGAARAVNLLAIEQLCQAVENAMALLKQHKINMSQGLADIFHAAVNMLDLLLTDTSDEKQFQHRDKVQNIVRSLNAISNSSMVTPKKYSPPEVLELQAGSIQKDFPENNKTKEFTHPHDSKTVGTDNISVEKPGIRETVRITTDKLEKLLLQAEEMITVKAMIRNLGLEFRELIKETGTTRNRTTSGANRFYQKSTDNIQDVQKELRAKQNSIFKEIDQLQRFFTRTVDDLLIDIRKTLMMPFSFILDYFPKVARDLAHDLKKEVEFHISGNEVEIDRRILEELKSPLLHLIRNSIDHGIEIPETRQKAGKAPTGTIKLNIFQTENRQVQIEITDDGAGISTQKLVVSAVKEGILTPEGAENLNENDKLKLVFLSGLSTSSYITSISGRGLGMAIVAEKVSELGGTYEIESSVGKGTRIVIKVPLTLTTFRGVLVTSAGLSYMLPLNTIEKVIRIQPRDIHLVKNQESILTDGHTIGLVRLSDALGINKSKLGPRRKDHIHILVLQSGQKKIAYAVDEIEGEQEGIVKPLGPQLLHLKNISGAIVLGDGRLVPVLNVSELMEGSRSVRSSLLNDELISQGEESVTKKQHILVAEDSLTSRSLLRNILEGAGYKVRTAVDGLEAFSLLTTTEFDLVVSDIEMPKMNGFELTTRIRGEDKLSSLPVILITSLESPEDRQRGMEAGANAYFIKSSFDQGSLIEVINRLI